MIQFEPEEKVLQIVRKHYFVVLPFLTLNIILAVAPMVVYSVFMTNFAANSPLFSEKIIEIVSEWKVFFYSLWLLVLWVLFFMEWTDYYLDVWIITDKRVIDIEQKGFFHREVTTFRREQIQDITVETKGILGTLLKFGTLHIQTAGHDRQIVIRNADHPEDVRALILKQTPFNK